MISSLRTFFFGALLGLVSALAAMLLAWLGAFDRVEGMTYDMRVRALAPPVDVPVKIIVLDQGSLAAGEGHGWSWPWNRAIYSYVVSFFNRTQVKALAFDVVFTAQGEDLPGDQEFGDAIRATPRYIGALMTSADTGQTITWPKSSPPSPFELQGLDDWLSRHPGVKLRRGSARFPYSELAQATSLYGHVSGEIEGDSVVRRSIPVQEFDGHALPRLGIAAWMVGQAHQPKPSNATDGAPVAAPPATSALPVMKIQDDTLYIGDRVMQLDEQGTALLHYYQPRKGSAFAFDVFSVADIIASEVAIQSGEKPKLSPDIFKDCHVLFGFSAPALYDLKPTPMNPAMPGVELHATTLANLILGDSMSLPSGSMTSAFTLLWSALVGALTVRGGRWWQLLLIALAALALPMVVGVLAYRGDVWWPIIMPMVAAAIALVAGIVYIYTFENRQRRFIRAAFARYLSDDVIAQIVANPSQLALGGQERELTVFFSDIAGFSSISERLSPTDTTKLLNAVLTVITDVILSEGGTLDKYMGDGVMAFWNAPADQPDHAVRAIRAALRCQRELAAEADRFHELAGGHPVAVRVGINTGSMLVGNLGSAQRFDYSVLGDAANLAARLEGANKAFGTHVLVSLETWSRSQGQFHGRVLGKVMVVGRETPVQIVEPLCFANEPMPAKALLVTQAIAMCGEGHVEQAIAQLESLSADPVAAALAKYLRTLDPKQAIDGVWRLTSK